MSDTSQAELDLEPTEDIDAPTEPIEGESSTEAPVEPEPEIQYKFLEVDDPDEQYVEITVDGEPQYVPFSELKNGYSRQADYTRKTQELAQQREQLREAELVVNALRTDPATTVQVLAAREGMSVEQWLNLTPQQQAASVESANDNEDSYADPLERDLARERDRVTRLEEMIAQQQAEARLHQAVNGLKSQYQIDDDEAVRVVAQAYQMGLGPEAFPMIYQSMAYQRMNAQQQARQQADNLTDEQRRQRQIAAQRAARQVETGAATAASAGGPGPDESNRNMSPAEAALAALEALGID